MKTKDLYLAQNKELGSILNVMGRYTVVVVSYSLARIIIGNIFSNVLDISVPILVFIPISFAATLLIFLMFPSSEIIYNKLCYFPHKCCILCVLKSQKNNSISNINQEQLQELKILFKSLKKKKKQSKNKKSLKI